MEERLVSVPATDLQNANGLLGAAIEEHIPTSLNKIRQVWDPDGSYADCLFRRQPATFPDVSFRRESSAGTDVIFAIEVKSWYIFAKESAPSFRIQVNRDFCHPADLCVVYPWALNSATSGTPKLFRPLVIGARKTARLRNEYWKGRAKTADDERIDPPPDPPRFYPTREQRINDAPLKDSGGNFGRVARTGVWKQEIDSLMNEERLCGIPLKAWQMFLSAFRENVPLDQSLQQIRAGLGAVSDDRFANALAKISEGLDELVSAVGR